MAVKTSDFLVIGAGVAGLSFALRAAKHGKVTVVTKKAALDSSTSRAQGGIAAVMSISDSIEQHVADTLDAGAGLCDADIVRDIVGQGQQAITDLLEWGVKFDLEKQEKPKAGTTSANHALPEFELGREGGHTCRRILHSKDTTGLEIATKLYQAALAEPNIELLENHHAIDLITTGKLGLVAEQRVLGAYVLEKSSGEVFVFRSDRVLLATGGCGKVYLYTTNPDIATGDGVAMAWRAGVAIANMEFVQFHPTCFYNLQAEGAEARSFLISEAVRGEGGLLVGADGEEFMYKYDPRGSLAPRDIVARAIDHEIKRTGQSCVFVDISHKPAGFFRERFPSIHETLLQYGIDAEKQPIPVVPAAHYMCGGIVSDAHGQTTLRGLFVAGEAGCTGLHGANRLASNSLLEGVVVATRAVDTMLRKVPIQQNESADVQETGMVSSEIYNSCQTNYPIPEWHHGDTTNADELVVIYHNWDEIRRLMWDYVSIVRTEKRLRRAATRLTNLKREVREFYWGHRVTSDILELRNLIAVASLIVDCAIRRTESRGLHYTLDFPKSDSRYEEVSTRLRRF